MPLPGEVACGVPALRFDIISSSIVLTLTYRQVFRAIQCCIRCTCHANPQGSVNPMRLPLGVYMVLPSLSTPINPTNISSPKFLLIHRIGFHCPSNGKKVLADLVGHGAFTHITLVTIRLACSKDARAIPVHVVTLTSQVSNDAAGCSP